MPTMNNANGQGVSVTSDGRLHNLSYSEPAMLAEILNGWAFYLIEDTVTPTGAGDYFLHVENQAAEPLVITGIEFDPVGGEVITAELCATYTLATTHAAVDSAINRYYGGSANAFTTKGKAEAGVDITGQGTTYIIRQVDTSAGVPEKWDLTADPIVLGTDTCLVLKAGTGTAAINNVCVKCHWIMEPRDNA